jgi:hypothetical protein
MKKNTFRLAALLIIILIAIPNVSVGQEKAKKTRKSEKAEGKRVKLFNGKDLNNWAFFLKDPAVDPVTVFTVQKKTIHISGNPFGYMRTKEVYSDYRLHVEWRWPDEATNSGIFVHGQEPDAIWLRCVECQLKAGNAGDFVCMNGADMNERTDKSSVIVNKMAASSEKPSGEWNTMEVVCKSSTIEVFVNGVLQNRGTGVTINKGFICLQSEGKDIEFRNVFLTRLKNK